jgi:hypothetical protein
MKPDWQNKSYAKTSSPTAPSTMHSKLKVGMTSLHSKIAVSNHNMPSQPMPAVRKFADGGSVRTRSDDEIGDTDPRTGKVDPGSYDRRMAEGAKNMERLRSAADSIKSFFSGEGKSSSDNITNNDGANESDKAKREIISAAMTPKAETSSAMTEAKTEPSYMKDVRDTLTKPRAEAAPAPAPAPASEKAAPVVKPVAKNVKKVEVKADSKKPDQKPVSKIYNEDGMPNTAPSSASNLQESSARSMPAPTESKERRTPNTAARMSPVGNSQKDVEYMAQQKNRQRQYEQASNTDTGDETKRLRDRTSTFVPGFGQIDKEGKIIPNVRGGRMASQVYGAKEDSFMESAEKRYLKSRIDAGNLTAMEKAQAKRAGLI